MKVDILPMKSVLVATLSMVASSIAWGALFQDKSRKSAESEICWWHSQLSRSEAGALVTVPGNAVGELALQVDPGQTPHEFYPASVPLDLRVLEAAWGCPVDPYTVQVFEIDGEGKPVPRRPDKKGLERFLCPSRFDRTTPRRGRLIWTMRDRNHTRYVARFLPAPNLPPDKGMCTLGDGDWFYFDEVVEGHVPGPIWSGAFLDWDNDGKQDLIAGRWTDFCHFWKNIGDRGNPRFSEREHWLVRDTAGRPIDAFPTHHGLAMSMIKPVDYDGDGRVDLFMDRYYCGRLRFHRNLGPEGFPIVDTAKCPLNIAGGPIANKVAFGDLDGDAAADALMLQVSKSGDSDHVSCHFGRGFTGDGTPRFSEGTMIELEMPKSAAKNYDATRTELSLADTDGDGDLDLYACVPPRLWHYENTGTPKRFAFAEGKQVERDGKPLDIGFRSPSVTWSDYDGDGDLDMAMSKGLVVYINEGDARTMKLGKRVWPVSKRQKALPRSNLRSFEMLDWDRDGDLDYVLMSYYAPDLIVTEWEDGLFRRTHTVEVDPNKADWYGCCAPGEYYALYSLIRLADWDNDGDLDLFFASEHSWRFGYIHYYKNLGGGKFASEVELRPMASCDHVRFVEGKRGQGAVVDAKTFLDYLSYRTEGALDPRGGVIRFWFKPNWDAGDRREHYFFYTEPSPATYGISAGDLARYYEGLKPELKLRQPFALLKTADGKLRFQMGEPFVETGPLNWKRGEWHLIEATWGAGGARLVVDEKQLAQKMEPVIKVPCGKRIHIGSRAWRGMQFEREYENRRRKYPPDWSNPADGVFDDFEILGAEGRTLLTLSFDGHADTAQGLSGARMKIGYRCTPDFADMNNDGLLDMVTMISDGRRGPSAAPGYESWGLGNLYLFPNVGTKTKPRLGKGILLRHLDGTPFRCYIRTQVTLVDWDRDGIKDAILSTQNCPNMGLNRAVDFFRNAGTAEKPVFEPRKPMTRLNDMLNCHHEVKLEAVDLTGNGVEDLVTSTDPGTCVFYRSFLEEKPVAVRIMGIKRGSVKGE